MGIFDSKKTTNQQTTENNNEDNRIAAADAGQVINLDGGSTLTISGGGLQDAFESGLQRSDAQATDAMARADASGGAPPWIAYAVGAAAVLGIWKAFK